MEYKGEFTQYNDAYRDRMMDNLDRIKYNADFVNQVRDMENYMHFNRPPALNPLGGAIPYQSNGAATVYASPHALPP
jgi:hypothetical protein